MSNPVITTDIGSKNTTPKVEEKKKVLKPIVTAAVVKNKQSFGQKFKSAFMGEKTFNDLTTSIIKDVVVPVTKNLLSDLAKQSIDILIHGEVKKNNITSLTNPWLNVVTPNMTTNYNAMAKAQQVAASKPHFSNMTFNDRNDAVNVLNSLQSELQQFGIVSVAELYQLTNQNVDYTDYNIGWFNLEGADVRVGNGGYYIMFPPVTSIK